MTIVEFARAGHMTVDAYRKARSDIRACYGDSSAEASGIAAQALARLFYISEWTQEELAAEEKKSQKWVDLRLRFGRFLGFSTTVLIPKNLTERRFRGYWEQTGGTNERQRFAAVARLMEAEMSLSKDRSPVKRRSLAMAILAKFADGKWHRFATIVAGVEAPEDEVLRVLTQMLTRGTYHTFCEKRKGGTSYDYRIVKGAGQTIDVQVFVQELRPIVEELKAEGKKHHAQASPAAVANIAHRLEVVIRRLVEDDTLQFRSTVVTRTKE